MTTNEALFAAAKRRMPGGVNSPVRACLRVGVAPRFVAAAKGSHLLDVEGNDYIDYVGSWGPAILGHAHPAVVAAVQEACLKGLTYGAPTARETELAECVRTLMPSLEKLRMVSSGTEAVMSAIRVARGFTGRDDIIKFASCYHGHSDGMLVKAGSGALTQGEPDSAGVPADVAKHTLVAEYNDLASVEALFEAHPQSVAAVIVEPVAANNGVILPAPGFLEGLRALTTRYGALLIFDEVITGFRLAAGGAQAYYGVTPDLTTLGKIVGGGLPAAVYGGRADAMGEVSPDGPVYQAGTLSGNPLATAAGVTTLKLLAADPAIYTRLAAKGAFLADGLARAGGDLITVTQVGSLLGIDWHGNDARFAAFYRFLLDRGIYMAPSPYEALFVSDAHTQDELERTVAVVREFFAKERA